MFHNPTGTTWMIASCLWGVAAVGVWSWTTCYEFKTDAPSATLASLERWPSDSELVLAGDRPTLVFFVHPRCPCTRASVRQLERTLTGAGLSNGAQPKLIVVATVPEDADRAWRATDVITRSARLPFAEVHWDTSGKESSRFGATTSGTLMLFQPDGALCFAGGVTSSRGHEGDNQGSRNLLVALRQEQSLAISHQPVFGCKLCTEFDFATCNNNCALMPSDGEHSTEGANR
ncbi:thioredoxin domain-containing protein [Aeoliella mucimassa]|nr:hypothetical protein [Aeoliella mucimassa]